MAQRVQESIEVQAPLQDVYSYWSNFQNFPRFMENIEEVRVTGEDTSHWKVKGPLGTSVEFDAKTTEMNPEQGVGWNTVDGQVMTSGEIRFQEVQPDRTRVEVTMNYATHREARPENQSPIFSPIPRRAPARTSKTSPESSNGESWAVLRARAPAGSWRRCDVKGSSREIRRGAQDARRRTRSGVPGRGPY